MIHQLPQLPFAKNALEPILSAETLEYHYGKHHKTYVDKLNELIQGTEFESKSLEEIIKTSKGPIFNNAAQHWNHSFYWKCLNPSKKPPSSKLLSLFEKDFGSFDDFSKQFQKAALGVFGSGWAWLIKNESTGKLSIETTSNAGNPIQSGSSPLLTCDVWEHAYYIDYRNNRAKFLSESFQILNWDFVENHLQSTWTLAA
jgi:Fe-Mn family superoxide dismutase